MSSSLNRAALTVLAVELLIALPAGAATAYTWVGNTADPAPAWGTGTNWQPQGTPQLDSSVGISGVNALVPANYSFYGPVFNTDATISNLSIGNGGYLGSGINGAPDALSKHLTVTGSTTLDTGVVCAVNGCVYNLGTLTNQSNGVLLAGAELLSLADHGGSSIESVIEWKGADIVRNQGAIALAGQNSKLENSDTGFDALLDFDTNAGYFSITDRTFLTRTSVFSNFGTLNVVANKNSTARFTAAGTFNNYDTASGVLSGGDLEIDGSSGGRAEFAFANADIRTVGPNTKIGLYGNAGIVDTSTGQNGLRNLGNLGGDLTVTTAFGVTPINSTLQQVGGNINVQTNGFMTVTGSLTQFQGAHITVSRNSSLVVTSNFTIHGEIKMDGLPLATIDDPLIEGDFLLADGSIIHGSGHFGGQIDSHGTLAPGLLPADFQPTAVGRGFVVMPASASFDTGRITLSGGSVTLESDSQLVIGLGGVDPGSGYSFVEQTGADDSTTLGGTLKLIFGNDFEKAVTDADTFSILTSMNVLDGAFDNVASGDRLTTEDGLGSFLVTYDGDSSVVLSDFQASTPEPRTAMLVGSILLLARRGRRCGTSNT